MSESAQSTALTENRLRAIEEVLHEILDILRETPKERDHRAYFLTRVNGSGLDPLKQYTVTQAARILRMPYRKMLEAVHDNELPHSGIGRGNNIGIWGRSIRKYERILRYQRTASGAPVASGQSDWLGQPHDSYRHTRIDDESATPAL